MDRPVHGRTFFEEVLRENLDVAERSIVDTLYPDADWLGGNLTLGRKMNHPAAFNPSCVPSPGGLIHYEMIWRTVVRSIAATITIR